jgi:hypothetical protein
MAVNFFWGSINRILAELNIAIDVSCHNMDFVQKLGLNHEAVQNDPKLADALHQSEEQALAGEGMREIPSAIEMRPH